MCGFFTNFSSIIRHAIKRVLIVLRQCFYAIWCGAFFFCRKKEKIFNWISLRWQKIFCIERGGRNHFSTQGKQKSADREFRCYTNIALVTGKKLTNSHPWIPVTTITIILQCYVGYPNLMNDIFIQWSGFTKSLQSNLYNPEVQNSRLL